MLVREFLKGFRSKRSLKIEELQKLTRLLLVGLSSGKDLAGIFQWVAENDENKSLREFALRLSRDSKTDHLCSVLHAEKQRAENPVEAFWFEILLQSQKGNQQLSQLLQKFLDLSSKINQLEKQLKAHLIVPKIQSLICCFVGVSFAIVLPAIWPALFPSFLGLGKPELFAAGIAGMLAGVYCFQLMQRKPQKRFRELVEFVAFFEFLAALSLSGLDFVSAWRKVLETKLLSEPTRLKLSMSSYKMESIRDLLLKLQAESVGPWKSVMTGLLWSQSGGMGVSKYIRSVLDFSVMDLCMEWEAEVRALSVWAIIPLCLFIFPSSMFLLIGPRILELTHL